MSRLVRRGVLVGAIAGAGYAAWRFLAARAPATEGLSYQVQPFPNPPRPVPPPASATAASSPATAVDADSAAVEPDADGNCPISHPIKGKLGTGIYHRPGAFAYERTRADRCYRDESAAESDGLRAAKR
ncbi:MAG: sunset domain-containing protein [Acidimicrobiia bacterium]